MWCTPEEAIFIAAAALEGKSEKFGENRVESQACTRRIQMCYAMPPWKQFVSRTVKNSRRYVRTQRLFQSWSS